MGPASPDPATVVELADALWRAEVERRPIDPISDARRDLTVQDAYAIQSHNIERRVAAGGVVRGRKVGLTSRPMQQLLGVDEPDFGVLLADMFTEDGDEIALTSLLQPRVEAEMAFVMARDLAGPGVTVADALTAVAGVLPAIEVVDSRIADWRITLVDTIADNASCAFLIGRRLEGPVTAAGVLAATDSMIAAVEIMDTRYCDRFRLPDSVADNAGAARVVLGAPAPPAHSAGRSAAAGLCVPLPWPGRRHRRGRRGDGRPGGRGRVAGQRPGRAR